jgi:hypothetical protein
MNSSSLAYLRCDNPLTLHVISLIFIFPVRHMNVTMYFFLNTMAMKMLGFESRQHEFVISHIPEEPKSFPHIKLSSIFFFETGTWVGGILSSYSTPCGNTPIVWDQRAWSVIVLVSEVPNLFLPHWTDRIYDFNVHFFVIRQNTIVLQSSRSCSAAFGRRRRDVPTSMTVLAEHFGRAWRSSRHLFCHFWILKRTRCVERGGERDDMDDFW